MTIHKTGLRFLILLFLILLIINIGLYFIFINTSLVYKLFSAISIIFYLITFVFFRRPNRSPNINGKYVLCPADGEIVAVEETFEDEYLHKKLLKVSVFMSIWNIHINWLPVSGIIKYQKHHSGRHFAAFLPKSSTENENMTTVIKMEDNREILVRQIAGAVARRVVTFVNKDQMCQQGNELGFIKFGSRVDLFLPLDTKINVELKQKVKGSLTIIGILK